MIDSSLLQRAATDRSLSHGAFRMLALLQTSKGLTAQQVARRLNAVNIALWRNQLVSAGYLPKQGGFKKKGAETISSAQTATREARRADQR